MLTRGPVHEAFAETISFDPEPGIVVPNERRRLLKRLLRNSVLKEKTSPGFQDIWRGMMNAKTFSGSAESGVICRLAGNGCPAIGRQWNPDINGFQDIGPTPR